MRPRWLAAGPSDGGSKFLGMSYLRDFAPVGVARCSAAGGDAAD
jgi:hypothetical protein